MSIKLDVQTPLLNRLTLKQLHNIREALCTEWKGMHRSPLRVFKQEENTILVVIFTRLEEEKDFKRGVNPKRKILK